MKTVLFVPGFPENLSSRDYRSVMRAIESKGYKVKFVPIDWKYKTVNEGVDQLQRTYLKHNPKQTVLAGFSQGAVTALLTGAVRQPGEIWLFSLSSYFKEDIHKLRQSWLNYIGKRRVEAFSKISFNALAPSIACKCLIFVGEKEAAKWPIMGERARRAAKLIKKSKLIVVPGAGHEVEHPNYIQAIKDNI